MVLLKTTSMVRKQSKARSYRNIRGGKRGYESKLKLKLVHEMLVSLLVLRIKQCKSDSTGLGHIQWH